MKTWPLLIIILLLATACSYSQFYDGISNVDKAINKFLWGDSDDDKELEPVQEECTNQECILDAFTSCKWAKGEYQGEELSIVEVEPFKNGNEDWCRLKQSILESSKPERTSRNFVCEVKSNNKSVEEFFVIENFACAGTMYELLDTGLELENDEGISITYLYSQGKDIIMDFKSENIIYLKRVYFAGGFFDNCRMEFQQPVKIPAKAKQDFTVACKALKGSGSRFYGDIIIEFYYKPDFQELTSVRGSFVGERH